MYSLLDRSTIDAMEDPATTFRWVFVTLGPSTFIEPQYVLTAQLPMDVTDITPRFRGGRTYYFPKFKSIGQLTLTFYETQSYYITSALRLWCNQVADDTGQGLPSEYMAIGELIAFDTVGIPRLSLTYYGMWPSAPGDLQYNQESRQLEVSCTFHVNSMSMITATTVASSLLGDIGISPSSLLSSVGLSALGSFI